MKKCQALVVYCLLIISTNIVGSAQTQTMRGAQLKPKFDLNVTKGAAITVSLQAENALLADIVQQLEQKTGLPITLSPKLKADRVTTKFMDAPLEAALAEIAPQSFADYVINAGWNMQPRCLAFFLLARNERQPSADSSLQPRSQAFVIEGDTEDGLTENSAKEQTSEEPPLQVSLTQGLLSVKARQQPLTAVLYRIADTYKLPFEMRYETAELIDLNVQSATPNEWLRVLPDGVQLYYRRHLQSAHDIPLHLILEKPTSKKTLREQKRTVRTK